jgi:hypothetical protein
MARMSLKKTDARQSPGPSDTGNCDDHLIVANSSGSTTNRSGFFAQVPA